MDFLKFHTVYMHFFYELNYGQLVIYALRCWVHLIYIHELGPIV